MKEEKILSIKGTLSEEWNNGHRQSCKINIFSDCIEINILPSGGTNNNFIYNYNDINFLKVEKTIEKRKKLVFTSKMYYLKMSICDYNGDKETKNIPSIITSEKDCSYISECIADYKRKIEEKKELERRELLALEEHERKKSEQFKKEQALKNEFIKYYDSLSHFFFQAKLDADAIQEKIKKLTNKYKANVFMYLINDMYTKIGDTKSVNQAMRNILEISYMKSLMSQSIFFTPVKFDGTRIYDSELGNLYKLMIDTSTNNIDVYIKDKIFRGGNGNTFIDNILSAVDEPKFPSLAPAYYFLIIFVAAIAFIKSLVICRNYNAFQNNEEMFKLFSNLSRESGIDSEYIAEKLYPLYKNYYKGIFDKEYSALEFLAFITFYNNNCINTSDLFKSVYEEEINNLKNELTKPEDTLEYEYNALFKVKYFLNNFNSRKYFGLIGRDYNIMDQDIGSIYILLYRELLRYIGENVSAKIFFQLLDDDFTENVRILLKIHENEVLQKEKERLLSGNMEKEKQLKYDKYSYDKIKTGYEFEEFLKNTFEKLGNVVELTKKSNDQGGDLILTKNGTRTVVQAKFYTNPVGNKAVQEVVAAKSFYKANKGMIVTNSTYTKSAISLAEVNDISLVDGDELDRIRNSIIETI